MRRKNNNEWDNTENCKFKKGDKVIMKTFSPPFKVEGIVTLVLNNKRNYLVFIEDKDGYEHQNYDDRVEKCE